MVRADSGGMWYVVCGMWYRRPRQLGDERMPAELAQVTGGLANRVVGLVSTMEQTTQVTRLRPGGPGTYGLVSVLR